MVVEADGEGQVGRDQTRQDLEVMVSSVAFIPSMIGSQWESPSREAHNLIYILKIPPWHQVQKHYRKVRVDRVAG